VVSAACRLDEIAPHPFSICHTVLLCPVLLVMTDAARRVTQKPPRVIVVVQPSRYRIAVVTFPRWIRYLRVLTVVLAIASLTLVVLPALGAAAFSLLVYQESRFPFAADAIPYVHVMHAVLGSVMAGWFALMYWVIGRLRTDRDAWTALVFSLAVWFVPDTLYSLGSRFWENAVLNMVVVLLFLPGLLGTRRQVR
jgi:hypothetical protein